MRSARRFAPLVAVCLLSGISPAVGAASAVSMEMRAIPRAPDTQVVDRIVARIEEDIITLSEVRQLAGFQQLLGGQSESDDKILNELIEQWVVNNEATTAGFPQPAESEIDREVARVAAGFEDPSAYNKRLADLGLTQDTVRRFVARQIYLARYLDYKFRPSVQVDDDAIAKYYKEQLTPALTSEGKPVPALNATVSDEIREVLVQQGINDRATSWFEETKSRLRIEIEPMAAASGQAP